MKKLAEPLKILALVAVLGAAGVYFFRSSADGEPGKYFYDLSEKRLYAAPLDAIPPDVGVGGASDDGVEAMVVRCPKCSDSKNHIVYFTRFTPELRQRILADRASESGGEGYSRTEVFKQTLVCRYGEDVWHSLSTDEGKAIRDSWATRCPEHGEPVEPVSP